MERKHKLERRSRSRRTKSKAFQCCINMPDLLKPLVNMLFMIFVEKDYFNQWLLYSISFSFLSNLVNY